MFKKFSKISRDIKRIKKNNKFSSVQKRELIFVYLKVTLLSLLHGRLMKVSKVSLLGHQMKVQSMSEFVNLFDEVVLSDFYRTRLQEPPKCIFDAGANVGFSAIYFRWLYPDAKVVCFEPDPDTFEVLAENLGDYSKNIVLHNIALADMEGSVPFYRRRDLSIASTTSSVHAHRSEKIDVPARTLSSFVDSTIDVLKMDIERMETKVFKEMFMSESIKKIRTFAMEYHYDYDDADNKLSELLTVFEKAGFVYTITLLSDKLPKYKTYRIEGWSESMIS